MTDGGAPIDEARQIAFTWYRVDEAAPVEIDAAAGVVGETFRTRLTRVRVHGDDRRSRARKRRSGVTERLMARSTRDRFSSVLAYAKPRRRDVDPHVTLHVTRMTGAAGSPYALHVAHDLTDSALAAVEELCTGIAAIGDWRGGIGTVQPVVNHRFDFGRLLSLMPSAGVPLSGAFDHLCRAFAMNPLPFHGVATGQLMRTVLHWNAIDESLARRVQVALADAGLGTVGTWAWFPSGTLWTVERDDDRARAAAALRAAGLVYDPMFLDPEQIPLDAAAALF